MTDECHLIKCLYCDKHQKMNELNELVYSNLPSISKQDVWNLVQPAEPILRPRDFRWCYPMDSYKNSAKKREMTYNYI